MSPLDRLRAAVDRLRARLTPVQQRLLVVGLTLAVVAVPLGFAAASSGGGDDGRHGIGAAAGQAANALKPGCPERPDYPEPKEQEPKHPKGDGKAKRDQQHDGKDEKGRHEGRAEKQQQDRHDRQRPQEEREPTPPAVVAEVGQDHAAPQRDACGRPRTPSARPAMVVDPTPRAPLTGIEGTFEGRTARPALIVKIDNVPDARPQSGLSHADIVIEEPVEGDYTRLAAVFHSQDAAGVGPVRSARTSDLELIPLFGRPIFASSGGNAGVIPQVQAANLVDMGDHVPGTPYYRLATRAAPHNLWTSTMSLYSGAPELPPPPPPVFDYREPGDQVPKGAFPVGGVALSFGGPERSRFTWDPASERWLRFMDGSPHMDAEGTQLAPVNVVILEIDYDYSNQLGRSVPHALTHGSGPATVLVGGQAIRGQWIRPTLADPLRLVDNHGDPIELNRGQTFLELPIKGGMAFI